MDALLFQSINLLGTRPTMLSYRQDVLTRQGLTVPETWDQLLQVRLGMGQKWIMGCECL